MNSSFPKQRVWESNRILRRTRLFVGQIDPGGAFQDRARRRNGGSCCGVVSGEGVRCGEESGGGVRRVGREFGEGRFGGGGSGSVAGGVLRLVEEDGLSGV